MSTHRGLLARDLNELRQRLIFSLLSIVCCSLTAYFFYESIARLFIAPLFKAHPDLAGLVYTNLTEAFFAYLKVSLLVGLICSFPILIYELWMFVSPGLHRREKKVTLQVVFWATLLFSGGATFAYFAVLPRLLTFFMGFAGPQLEALPKLDGYLTFVARTTLTFGLAFEIPFLMVVATRTGLVEPRYFAAKRTFYLLAILLLAFLLTAGDLFGCILLALPLAVLYETGILASRFFGRKPATAESETSLD